MELYVLNRLKTTVSFRPYHQSYSFDATNKENDRGVPKARSPGFD